MRVATHSSRQARHEPVQRPGLEVVPRRPVPVTVVIPTLNEAHQLGEALEQLDWADQVVVVDGGSTDDTLAIAEAGGAIVEKLPSRTIGAQRNVGIDVARNEWILALDADERVTPELVQEIREIVDAPKFGAYRIRFRNFYLGKELKRGHWGRDWHVRLFRRAHRYSECRVHERLQEPAEIGVLRSTIHHTPYRDLTHHLRKIVFYSRLGAEDLHARGKRAGFRELALRPMWRFWREYVGYRGFLDGRMGLLMAGLSSVAAFLKYAYLYSMSADRTGTE